MNTHMRRAAACVREACGAVIVSPFGCIALGIFFLGFGANLRRPEPAPLMALEAKEPLRDAVRSTSAGAVGLSSRERELMDRMEAELRLALLGFEDPRP